MKCYKSWETKFYHKSEKTTYCFAMSAIVNKLLKSAYQVLLSGKEYIDKGISYLNNSDNRNYAVDLKDQSYNSILLPIEEYLIIGHYSLKSNGFRYISSTISILIYDK